MTGPLCTIDINRLPGPARRHRHQTTWRPGASYTQGFPAFLQLGAHVGQAEPSSTRLSGITPGAGRQSVVPRLDALTFIGHPPIKEPQSLHLLVPGSGVGHDCATVGVAD
jgi:hypothetical protein